MALVFRQSDLNAPRKTIKARVSTIKNVLIVRLVATLAEKLNREIKNWTLVVEQISNLKSQMDLAGISRAVAGQLRLGLAPVKPLANP